uniref:ANK_REP_REGION domain-containing protein n=1 Tax=Elaeophora elaphi TaxID=1147741 RepID=A0A0R3RJ66_9BILA
MATNGAEARQEDLEYRLMNLDFDAKKFPELEDLQITGRLQEVGRIVGKHLDNEHLMQYITRFRKQQNRLNAAMAAIEENNLKKLRNLVDRDLVEARNSRNGRAAVHYAAVQKNAIYDTLIDCGADGSLADSLGITAAQYRQNPNLTIPSPLMISKSTDLTFKRYSFDEHQYDPDGDVEQLEQIFLDGRGYLLADKTSKNMAASQFLNGSSKYQ